MVGRVIYIVGGPCWLVAVELQPIDILNSAFTISSSIPKTGLVIAKISVWINHHSQHSSCIQAFFLD